MNRRTRFLVAAIAGAATLAAPGSALAAKEFSIAASKGTKFPDRTMILTLPTQRVLDVSELSLTENGQPVSSLRVQPITSAAASAATILAIDASKSMHGDAIRQAMIAARSFAKHRTRGSRLGVVLFSRKPRVVLEPTSDEKRIADALRAIPQLTQGTRLRDAAVEGIRLLDQSGATAGSVVVLSDGADVGSVTSAPALGALAKDKRIRVFTVGLRSPSYDGSSLREVATVANGRYAEARRAQDLPPIFAALADQFAAEHIVRYKSGEALGTTVAVEAHVDGVEGSAITSYDTPALRGAAAKARPTEETLSDLAIVLIALGAGILLAVVMYLALRPRRWTVQERVADYASDDATFLVPESPTPVPSEPSRRKESALMKRLEDRLDIAGMSIKPAPLVMSTAIATIMMIWLLAGPAHRPVLAVFAAFFPVGVIMFVRAKIKKRRRTFDDQLPDTLQLLASALRAGHSFSGALASAVDNAAEPSRSELKRAVHDEALGVPVDEALQAVSDRMQSTELDYVGIVARLQRESGGNTAEVLDRVVVTIRERQGLRRMVRTLTAQGRFGGGVVSALPIAMLGILSVLQGNYLETLFQTSSGVLMLAASGLLMLFGWLAIMKIVDIEP